MNTSGGNPIGQYILDPFGNPVPEPEPLKWAAWYEKADRVVQQDRLFASDDEELVESLDPSNGPVLVSTVFLGLDHGYSEGQPPVLWETMVFNCPELEDYTDRYTSQQDAKEGHRKIVAMVREKLNARSARSTT